MVFKGLVGQKSDVGNQNLMRSSGLHIKSSCISQIYLCSEGATSHHHRWVQNTHALSFVKVSKVKEINPAQYT